MRRRLHNAQPATLLGALLIACALIWTGCGDDSGTPTVSSNNAATAGNNADTNSGSTGTNNGSTGTNNGSTGTNNGSTGTNNATTGPQACGSSAECDQGEDTAGQLCVDGACTPCFNDAPCASDPYYADGASCVDGQCVPCSPGDIGCICDADDACQEGGVCEAGSCVACSEGAEGCPCFGNGSCDAGLRCEAEVCVECVTGEEGCPCFGNGTCADEALACLNEVCVIDPCPEGSDTCPCTADDACDEGLTCGDDQLCRPCSPDVEGCPCANDVCEGGLVCDADDTACRAPLTCEAAECLPNQLCEEGDDTGDEGEDATCLEACEPGFVWSEETASCVEIPDANCQPGQPGSIAAQCDAQSRVCLESDGGAACGACVAGTTDEGGALESCRPVRTCAALGCAEQNRDCVAEQANDDAACGACLDGFAEMMGLCVANPDTNCQPGQPGSILADCDAQNRLCVEAVDGASCGDCAEGYVEDQGACVVDVQCDPIACAAENRSCENAGVGTCGDCLVGYAEEGGVCVEVPTCDPIACATLNRSCEGAAGERCGDCVDGTRPPNPDAPDAACESVLTCAELTCEDGEFCIEGTNAEDATCGARPCGEGQAMRRDALGFDVGCVDCGILCGTAEGETDNLWAYTLQDSNRCVCETEEGYYYTETGDLTPAPCDQDGDGWVQIPARVAIESDDPTLRENARCRSSLHTIDRFVLENELGQELELFTCEQGLLTTNDQTLCTKKPVTLYESIRNDEATELERASDTLVPPYTTDDQGRRLNVKELNPLTKGCVSTTGDYNDNGLADVNEYHGATPTQDPPQDSALDVFMDVAYFVELHRAWFEEGDVPDSCGPGVTCGRYVIQERTRCDGFPLDYITADGSDYWRSCTRRRDARYNADPSEMTPVGFDFAQYSCDATSGACPTPPPVTPSVSQVEIPEHGLCAIGAQGNLPPNDGVWRGMSHHSQFKCVVVQSQVEDPANAPQHVVAGDLYSGAGGDYQLNLCHAEGSEDAPGVLANPSSPELSCAPVLQDGSLATDTVGFAAVRYIDEPSYRLGCIDEFNPSSSLDDSAPWKALCPGIDVVDQGVISGDDYVVAEGFAGDFGRLICGCASNYGGPDCRTGCPDGFVHYGGDDASCADNFGYCPISPITEGRSGYWMCAQTEASAYAPGSAPESAGGGYTVRGAITLTPTDGARLCEDDADDCATGYRIR